MGRLIRKKSPEEKKRTREKSAARSDERQDSGAKDGGGSAAKLPGAVASAMPRAVASRAPHFYTVSIQFLREVKVELKKVTWPSRKQAMGSTVVMIIFVLILAFFLGMTDSGLACLVRTVLGGAR